MSEDPPPRSGKDPPGWFVPTLLALAAATGAALAMVLAAG